MNASAVVLCVMTTVAVAFTAGCNEKCKHHQISTEDWSDRCLEYEASGSERPGGERRPAVFGSTTGRGGSRSDEVDAATTSTWRRSLGRPAVRRPDHPAGTASLPRSAAPAGPDLVPVSVHAHR